MLDAVRGFSVISMILFHLCYDLTVIYGLSLPWFTDPLQSIWRASIAWVFIFLAGVCFRLSRSNIRRAALYAFTAVALWLTTSLIAIDAPIRFGIIHCLATCTFITWLLHQCDLLPTGLIVSIIFFCLFLLFIPVTKGYIGFYPFYITLPTSWYEPSFLFWLGFARSDFISGDYYPILPFLLLYFSGYSAFDPLNTFLHKFLVKPKCTALRWIGRHALSLYIIHQPCLLMLLWILIKRG